MMTIIIIELLSFLFWTRSVYGGDIREYSEYKFDLDISDFSEYPEVEVHITGYCKEQTRHGEQITVNGAFNECVYNYFVFEVYSGENYLGETRKFMAIKNVLSCNEEYGPYSWPVDEPDTDLPRGLYKIHFSVTKSGGGCSSLAGTRRLMEDIREYSEYKFDLDSSDFSEYPQVAVYITGYCKENTRHGEQITQNGAFNECVYNSFVFKVFSADNYLGVTRKFMAMKNVLTCNEEYGPYSWPVDLPIDETNPVPRGLYKIHFSVTKSGGGDC